MLDRGMFYKNQPSQIESEINYNNIMGHSFDKPARCGNHKEAIQLI